jgi:hypothetical protein
MSNYLRGITQAVGFAGDNKGMDPPPPWGRDGEWDLVSNHSGSHGQGNLLNPEQGQQGEGATSLASTNVEGNTHEGF